MKVLHIIPTLSNGGAEKMLVDIVEEMSKSGICIEVLVLSRQGDFYSKEIEKMGVNVYFGATEKVYHPYHIHTVRLFMKKDFDIIHTHLFAPQLYVALAKKTLLKSGKLITTEHSTNNRRRGKIFLKLLDKYMYNQYDRIIAITKGTKAELNDYLTSTINKTIVIENGIKLEQYENATPLEHTHLINGYREGDVLVLMVAAMREQKDHETVIRASVLMPSNYHIIFVGDGARLEDVQEYAKENGGPNIHFLGRRSDVPSIMKTCDIFVLSSHWEGFGLVAVEAMAAGLPVIASNVEGLNEVVRNAGILFNDQDEKKLANYIVEVITSTNLYSNLVEKGMQRSNVYNVQKTVDRYVEMYDECLMR